VMPLALGVGETEIDVFDVVLLDHLKDFLRGHGSSFSNEVVGLI
jgi:hypothetical protein